MNKPKILITGAEKENRAHRRFEPGPGRTPLELSDLSSVTVQLSEVEDLCGLKGMWKETGDRFVVFNAARMAQRFYDTLGGLSGPVLDQAAGTLLLGKVDDNKKSDHARFCAWVANRAQPLDEKTIKELGRFYAKRLNNVLGEGLKKTKENKSGRNPSKRNPHRVMKVHPAPSAG